MPVNQLRPSSDGATVQFTPTPSGTHYTTIDDTANDPSTPDTADYIEETTINEVDMINLADAPADYGSSNNINLHVYGQSSVDRSLRVQLRKSDETVVTSVFFDSLVVGDRTAQWKNTGNVAVTLTKAEVDGLYLRFICEA